MTDFYLELFDFHRCKILSATERTLVSAASVMPIISYPTKVTGLLTVTGAVAEVGVLPVRGVQSSKICNFPGSCPLPRISAGSPGSATAALWLLADMMQAKDC